MRPRIVVGVDGTAPSLRALVFALNEARLRSGTVAAVIAWHEPHSVHNLAATADPTTFADSAAATLGRALWDVRADEWPAPVERHVIRGSPADVLVHAAADAALLAIGSRGRGGLTGVLLGSVAQQLVHHATCPVVVVPTSTHNRRTVATPQ